MNVWKRRTNIQLRELYGWYMLLRCQTRNYPQRPQALYKCHTFATKSRSYNIFLELCVALFSLSQQVYKSTYNLLTVNCLYWSIVANQEISLLMQDLCEEPLHETLNDLDFIDCTKFQIGNQYYRKLLYKRKSLLCFQCVQDKIKVSKITESSVEVYFVSRASGSYRYRLIIVKFVITLNSYISKIGYFNYQERTFIRY